MADLGINVHFFWCHSANLFRTINEYDEKLWWQGALVITFVNKKYVFLHLCSHRVLLECSQEFAEWGVGVPAQQVSQPVCQSISKILRRNFTFFLGISCIWRRKNLGLKSWTENLFVLDDSWCRWRAHFWGLTQYTQCLEYMLIFFKHPAGLSLLSPEI